MIKGQTLIGWGFKPGPWFKAALEEAARLRARGMEDDFIRERLVEFQPVEPATIPRRETPLPYSVFLEPESDLAHANLTAVKTHMDSIMRVPTVKAGAIMPDACPVGSQLGTIPVGGVVACENAIHPSFHSSDVCCSMAITILNENVDPAHLMDKAMKITHFGPGGRSDENIIADIFDYLHPIANELILNPFLKGLDHFAKTHFMTQGDGNHFLFVGELEQTGQMAIVTHHGSRGLGANLYKRGKACAEAMTRKIAPEVPAHQAWIVADSQEGQDYWEALQAVRLWTKMNHFAIHDEILEAIGRKSMTRFWNEHNFVFRKSDGLFYHAKGATPVYDGFAHDDCGVTLIPMNMAEPILITEHRKGPDIGSLDFAPHGAGRNFSRSQHVRELTETHGDSRGLSPDAIERIIAEETAGLDIRAFNGKPDLSELPSAYKSARKVTAEIKKHGLAEIVERIMPLGSIMAGDTSFKRVKK